MPCTGQLRSYFTYFNMTFLGRKQTNVELRLVMNLFNHHFSLKEQEEISASEHIFPCLFHVSSHKYLAKKGQDHSKSNSWKNTFTGK